ncbi:MAG: phenylalanine--tRNA ligase subunit beta [Saprospiraceae bacterium]
MKISLNWIKSYLDLSNTAEEIGEILTSIGLELEHLEEVETIKGGMAGLVIGQVLALEQHPNADRLKVTKVNIGGEEPLSIVCGGPNVALHQKVVIATVGTTLYDTEGKPFQIKKSKVRGEDSEGMICAEDEIGLGASHEGVMVLDESAQIGMPAAEYFHIESDQVFEIGLTPNRSDATSHLGVARDLSAYLQVHQNTGAKVILPDISAFKVDNNTLPAKVKVSDSNMVPRYAGLSIGGITVKESPDWLKNRLLSIGQRPINNIVDITNFVHHEMGQPLHAFDYDQIAGNEIHVGALSKETLFMGLDEVERKLNGEEIVIADANGTAMCIGGVFGGAGSGVKTTTKNIFLEAAFFHPIQTRKAATFHNLRTDSSKTFEKGVDPNNCVYALKRAALLIAELTGGTISSDIIDLYPNKIEQANIELKREQITRHLGFEISAPDIEKILKALEMGVVQAGNDAWTVSVPTNKADVTRPVDLIEEILRIYGFDRVPISNSLRISLQSREIPDAHFLRNRAADHLTANGFCEMMALSISQESYFSEMLKMDAKALVKINNTSNLMLDTMRADMLPSALETVNHNLNRQQNRIRLYEFGKVYSQKEGKYKEKEHLTLTITGPKNEESWIQASAEGDFFQLKSFVERMLLAMGITSIVAEPSQDSRFAFGLQMRKNQEIIGNLGLVNQEIARKMGIKQAVFFADFDWKVMMRLSNQQPILTQETGKFPTTRRDLALVLDQKVAYSDIVALANRTEKKLLKQVNLFDVYTNEAQLGAGKKSYAVSFLFEHSDRTLADDEVDRIIQKMIQQFERELGAQIRK